MKTYPTPESPTDLYKFASIYIEFGQSMTETERQTYSLLELFGDVGGLFDGLKILIGIVLAPISAFNMRSMILIKAFRQEPKDDGTRVDELMSTKKMTNKFTNHYIGLKRVQKQGYIESYFRCTKGRAHRRM